MFQKVTNTDLMSRLINLENKMDIVITRSHSFRGCCDCQSREVFVYRELKEYLEEKFCELNAGIKSICNERKTTNPVDVFNDIFEKYKMDIINNLQTIISNSSIQEIKSDIIVEDLYNVFHVIEEKLSQLNNHLKNLSSDTNINFNNIDSKLGSIYFENELIKHQLKLDEDIRNTIDEINSLTDIINTTIQEIDDKCKNSA